MWPILWLRKLAVSAYLFRSSLAGKRCTADTMPCKCGKMNQVAERVGFEPTVRFPVRSLSRRVLSTAQSPLRGCDRYNPSKAPGFEQSSDSQDPVGVIAIPATSAESRANRRNPPTIPAGHRLIRNQNHRRAAKKDCSREAQSGARTPEVISTW